MELPVQYNKLDWRKGEKSLVREEYRRIQENLCCACGRSLDGPPAEEIENLPVNKRLFPKGFFKHPVHLHHDHDSGLTIGAIHSHCNAVLWQYYGE